MSECVLITGASSGIGAEFARQFHRRGAEVVLVARRRELLESMRETFERERKGSAVVFPADLADEEDLERVANYLQSRRIDVLVNNAGRGSFGHFDSIPWEVEQAQIALNVTAVCRLSHAVIPQMKERGSGSLVIVSSIAGFQSLPYMATYGATKAFDLMHALALHHELKPFSVRVLAVCPGPTATGFQGVARVPGRLTGIGRDTVEDVVYQSLRALEEGKALVVPCLRSRMLSWMSRLLPRGISARIVGKILKNSLTGGL